MEWNWKYEPFDALTNTELYAILRLRSEVFVVEQNCVYLDMDGKDAGAFHLSAWDGEALVAYCRILPPGLTFEQASIGRVISNAQYRGMGAGRQLMERAIALTLAEWQTGHIVIGAQLYLKSFYESLGFRQFGEGYLEDGIPHIHMEYIVELSTTIQYGADSSR